MIKIIIRIYVKYALHQTDHHGYDDSDEYNKIVKIPWVIKEENKWNDMNRKDVRDIIHKSINMSESSFEEKGGSYKFMNIILIHPSNYWRLPPTIVKEYEDIYWISPKNTVEEYEEYENN